MKSVKINVEYLKVVNYALCHNKIPICQSIDIVNTSEAPLEDVQVLCEGEYVTPYESTEILQVSPDETVRVVPFEIVPDGAKLAALTERIVTSFTITVTSQGERVGQETFSLEMMPYDHWLGSVILPQMLVSFITPNHPAITALTLKVAAMLKRMTGSSALTEYQSGNPNEVRLQVAALFATLHQEGIVYRAIPASYEVIGQRITMPDQVLATKIGNCIELTLLMASVLESIGLNSVVILQKGHAYLGVWLVDDCALVGVSDDASFIEKKCSQGISEMLVLECTKLTSEQTSFEQAIQIAELNLADHALFDIFIDVKRCRLEGIRPLPSKALAEGNYTVAAAGVAHEECVINVVEHDRYDLTHIADSKKELTKFDIWERKLLDFSLRNSLLNTNLRRRGIQFISFDVASIEDYLQDGKEYTIACKPNVEFSFDSSEQIVRSKLYPQLEALIRNDIAHCTLHTYKTEAETNDILKNIYKVARSSIEETGANSLYLAIGTLRWFETERSETARYAPILLLPVEMVYKRGKYCVRTRDEEILLNVTLIEFLRQNYDISIGGLDPLPRDESGVDVSLIFATIRDALKEQKRWDVEEECLLGIFSFSKYLMWNDIHANHETLREHDILNSLVEGKLTWHPEESTADLRQLDKETSPAGLALPLTADSSQIAAIIEGGKGHSFVLYGPPGTGKSQTITNLIANALYQGKRVLFVAQKMAALDVVQSRLEKIGLGPFCLELHSNKATKRHVLTQLEEALKVAHILPPEGFQAQADKIFEMRKQLIDYMNALHDKDPQDKLSLYEYILHYESLEVEPLASFTFEEPLDQLLMTEGVRGVEELLGARLETVVKLVGQPAIHPLKGLRLDRAMLTDSSGVVEEMRRSQETLRQALTHREDLQQTKEQQEQIVRDNAPEILAQNVEQLRTEWRAAKAKWFIPRFFAKRSFMKRLKQFNAFITEPEVDKLIDDLFLYHKRHAEIEQLRAVLSRHFGLETPKDTMPEAATIEESIDQLDRWSTHSDKMRDWLHWSEYADELESHGLGCVVRTMYQGEHQPAQIKDAFMKALFKYKAEERIRRSEVLATFEGMLFDQVIQSYRTMIQEFQLLTQKELYARLAAGIPRMTDDVVSGSEIGLLNRNISNGGRGVSLRELFAQIPTLLPRLCPCMLMSPMSVAQYTDMTQEQFDLVIFDEASQMPTSEAVGAIARGKALIVVGDPKQMPPTSFFATSNVDVEEAYIDDMESILEDCRTLEIPALQLSWHYRSRHESLIAFSNSEYYDGSLITFPSVDDQNTKVYHVPIEGYYDKGGRRTNAAEAEAIIREVIRRLRDPELRTKSIGVISFSVAQQGLIEDMLQAQLDREPALQEIVDQMPEPIFVKNLENVQGDERDIILFSIGYGPDKEGKVSMNFGPLNNAGGERRLNVAVSRARQEMYIFSTLRSADIDLRRSKALGVKGLKDFLLYAETQSLPTYSQTQAESSDTLLADQIAAELAARGHQVKTNVGRSSFRVKVAICDPQDPEVYRLGILLDGESYNKTPTTRDREVGQPSVLSALQWQVMRVWSVDWFNNKARVLSRIEERLATALSAPVEVKATPKAHFDISQEQLVEETTQGQQYRSYSIAEATARGSMRDMAQLIRSIIATEQPITFALLCKRVATLTAVGRVTPTLQATVKELLTPFYQDESEAIWLSKEDSSDYHTYRTDSGREVANIPRVELINALSETLREQVALSQDSLTLLAARKLGFNRRGSNVDAAFSDALTAMIEAGTVEAVGSNLRLK